MQWVLADLIRAVENVTRILRVVFQKRWDQSRRQLRLLTLYPLRDKVWLVSSQKLRGQLLSWLNANTVVQVGLWAHL